MDRKKFEKLVREAITALPEKTHKVIDNVAFVIENNTIPAGGNSSKLARCKRKGGAYTKKEDVLLGLYEGIPNTERAAGYSGVLPDKITIFQRPLEELSGGNEKKLKKLIYETVWHEVGHHIGLSEREIRAIEKRRRKTVKP